MHDYKQPKFVQALLPTSLASLYQYSLAWVLTFLTYLIVDPMALGQLVLGSPAKSIYFQVKMPPKEAAKDSNINVPVYLKNSSEERMVCALISTEIEIGPQLAREYTFSSVSWFSRTGKNISAHSSATARNICAKLRLAIAST